MSEQPAPNEPEPEREESFVSILLSFGFLIFLVLAFKSSVLDANNIPSGSMIPTLKIGDYLFVNKMRYSLRVPFADIELLRIDDPRRGDIVTFIPPDDSGKNYVKRVVGMPGDRIRIRHVRSCELPEEAGQDPRKQNPDFQRGYACETGSGLGEPVVALVEFKPGDEGPWLNNGLVEIDTDDSRSELSDADNAGVLHPDYLPTNYDATYPVLFQEQVSGVEHYVVESSIRELNHYNVSLNGDGFVIQDGHYFVMGDNRDDSKDSRYLGPIERSRIRGKAVVIYFSINWFDDICREYVHLYERYKDPEDGFHLPDFPPERQQQLCSLDLDARDVMARVGSPLGRVLVYMQHMVQYRIPRMQVRWERIGRLLE